MNLNTLKTLESVPLQPVYSKYGESLDRVFHSKSLKSLIKSLRTPKKFICKDFITNEETPKQEKIADESSDIFSNIKTIDTNISNSNSKRIQKIFPSRIIYNTESSDPGKYNPNYNSISRNIPSVKIILPLKEKKKLLNQRDKMIYQSEKSKSNKKSEKKINIKPQENSKSSFITALDDNFLNKNKNLYNDKNNNNVNLPPIINNIEQKENNFETIERNNHALRFSKYIPRKFDFMNSVNDKVTYLEPYDYILQNNVVDFKKMLARKEKFLINKASLEIPSFNIYNPNFDSIDKNQAKICFSHDKNIKDDKANKKLLVKKIWSSYDEVNSDYKLINGDKLEKTKDILKYL